MCGLGQTANPRSQHARYFRHEYERHIVDRMRRVRLQGPRWSPLSGRLSVGYRAWRYVAMIEG